VLQRGFCEPPCRAAGPVRAGPGTSPGSHGHVAAARNIRDALHRSGRLARATLVALDLEIGVDIDAGKQGKHSTWRCATTARRRHRRWRRRWRSTGPKGVPPTPRASPPRRSCCGRRHRGPDADALWRESSSPSPGWEIDTAIAMLDVGRGAFTPCGSRPVTEVLHDRLDAGDSATLLLLAHLFGSDWTAGGSHAGRVRAATADRLQWPRV
jgi:hypothetical protein